LGCAGFSFPLTEHKVARWMIETSHKEVNVHCMNLTRLSAVVFYLEHKYEIKDLTLFEIRNLIYGCEEFLIALTPGEIKQEMYADLQFGNPDILRELGGIVLEYEDTTTESGLLPSFKLEQETYGPRRRLVAIYDLNKENIILLNYSGTDNAHDITRQFPFFTILIEGAREGTKVLLP